MTLRPVDWSVELLGLINRSLSLLCLWRSLLQTCQSTVPTHAHLHRVSGKPPSGSRLGKKHRVIRAQGRLRAEPLSSWNLCGVFMHCCDLYSWVSGCWIKSNPHACHFKLLLSLPGWNIPLSLTVIEVTFRMQYGTISTSIGLESQFSFPVKALSGFTAITNAIISVRTCILSLKKNYAIWVWHS